MSLENLTNMSRMDLLRSLGLAPRIGDYFLPALGIFAAGAVLGAGTALLFAPRSGEKMRKQLREEMRSKLGELEQLIENDESKRRREKRERQEKQGRQEQERAAGKQAA